MTNTDKMEELKKEFEEKFEYLGSGKYAMEYDIYNEKDELEGQNKGYAIPEEMFNWFASKLAEERESIKQNLDNILGLQFVNGRMAEQEKPGEDSPSPERKKIIDQIKQLNDSI